MSQEAALIAIVAACVAGGMRMAESLIAKALPRKHQLSDDEHRWLSQLFETSIKNDKVIVDLLHAAETSAKSSEKLAHAIEQVLKEMESSKSNGSA